VPASSPTTSMPACASGSDATPPAAPSPMMTTSVSLSLVAIALPHGAPAPLAVFREVVVVGRLVIRLHRLRLEALLIRRADHRADAGIVDEIPANEIGVAAVVGIAERPLVRVAEHHRKERRRAAGEAGGCPLLDLRQHCILIAGRQILERRAARGSRVAIE